MAYTKTEEFAIDQITLSNFAKALSHPARVAILQLLLERKNSICGDIVDQLPLSQSTVSQHLKELREAKLIKGVMDGPRVQYEIDEETWAKARTMFEKLFKRSGQVVLPAEAPDYFSKRISLLDKLKSEEGE